MEERTFALEYIYRHAKCFAPFSSFSAYSELSQMMIFLTKISFLLVPNAIAPSRNVAILNNLS